MMCLMRTPKRKTGKQNSAVRGKEWEKRPLRLTAGMAACQAQPRGRLTLLFLLDYSQVSCTLRSSPTIYHIPESRAVSRGMQHSPGKQQHLVRDSGGGIPARTLAL